MKCVNISQVDVCLSISQCANLLSVSSSGYLSTTLMMSRQTKPTHRIFCCCMSEHTDRHTHSHCLDFDTHTHTSCYLFSVEHKQRDTALPVVGQPQNKSLADSCESFYHYYYVVVVLSSSRYLQFWQLTPYYFYYSELFQYHNYVSLKRCLLL